MTTLRRSVSWRHSLEWGEPALGFSSRLAALNGRTHRAFLKEMMVPRLDLDQGDPTAISAVASIGSADFKQLLQFSPAIDREAKMATLGTETLRQLSVRRRRFFYCPYCIQDDLERYEGPDDARPWLRVDWIVSHFRACNRHNVFLVSTPIPDESRGSFDFAAEISVIRPMLSELCIDAISAPHSPFQDWLRARLDGKRDPGNWLDTMQLYAAVDFCETLGLSARAHLHPPINSTIDLHTTRSRTLSVAELAAAADDGFHIARNGEASIIKFLTGRANAQLNFTGPWGLRDTFGCVYELLDTTQDDEAFEQPRAILRKFAIETIPLPAGKNVLGHILDQQVVHSVRSISVETGIDVQTMRRMLEGAGLINSNAPALRDHRTTFPSEKVLPFLSDLRGAWTTPQIEEFARIPAFHMRYIVSSGKLPKIVSSAASKPKTLYSNASVQTVFEKLFGNAVRVKEPAKHHVSPFNARKVTGVAATDVIDLIYAGQIWTGTTVAKPDYSALLVDADELLTIIGRDRKLGYNQAEAAKVMSLHDKYAVSVLISAGYLTTVKQFCPIARRTINMVPRASVDSFRAQYISLAEVAKAAGLHCGKVLVALERAGLKPAIVHDESIGAIFHRAQVEAVLSIPG